MDGRGGEHAPNIATAASVQVLSDSELMQVIERGLPSRGMPGFGKSLNEAQLRAVAEQVRELQGRGKPIPLRGNPQVGKNLFFGKAKCADCHLVNGRGGFIASDLSRFGSTHSPQEIRDLITDPNKNLDPRNEIATVTTTTGQTYRGVMRNEDNFSLQLQALDGSFRFLDKAKVVHIERSGRSLMPDNYASTLTPGEIDDLVAYLVAIRP